MEKYVKDYLSSKEFNNQVNVIYKDIKDKIKLSHFLRERIIKTSIKLHIIGVTQKELEENIKPYLLNKWYNEERGI